MDVYMHTLIVPIAVYILYVTAIYQLIDYSWHLIEQNLSRSIHIL